MINRKDISLIHNRWHDGQRVDRSDMNVEQERNIQTDAAIVHHHFGSGVLLSSPQQNILFDSDNLDSTQASLVAAGNFDGTGIDPHQQPSDVSLGNQIEISLTDSAVFGRLSVKVAIIGLSFDDSLQMERMYFYRNEKQVTSKHYKRILTILFNDFKGNNNCSRNLGGRIVIKETLPFQLSRDALMKAQDVMPDIFWRDFKVATPSISLFETIQNGIGAEYNADNLQINVTGTTDRELVPNDVTSQVGQKFIAETDNIQKITLLLGVRRDDSADEDDIFDWSGDLVVSVYPLQTSVSCPSDIVPDLAIDFDPSNEPIVQLSYDQGDLQDIGYVLTDVLQPVDFVFNSTKLGSGSTSGLTVGNFYVVTIKRTGAATSGTIFTGVGTDRLENSRLTLFSGVWADVTEEDLWFQIWTDSSKIADGQGYDEGNGIQFDKTIVDTSTGALIDNEIRYKSFITTGENVINIGVIQALEEETLTVQDERSGNNIFSRKEFIPSFSFVTTSGLSALKEVGNPLVLGCIQDNNPKQNPGLEKEQMLIGLANGDLFCIVNPDPDLLSLNLIGSKLIPNADCAQLNYRIFGSEYCTDGYGDVNGDGYIDAADIAAASDLIGESIFFESTQQKIIDGYFSTLELLRADVDGDGYITAADVDLITQYVNRQINGFPAGTSFDHLCLRVQQSVGRYDGYFDCDGYVRIDGYTGLNIVDPDSLSQFTLLYDGYLTDPVIEADSVFTIVPFVGTTFLIEPQPYWQPWLLGESSKTRNIFASFYEDETLSQLSCNQALTFQCQDRASTVPECDPGKNNIYVPGHLLLENGGEILRPDGTHAKLDFEIGTVILQLPEEPLEEVTINILDKFVVDRGDGLTNAGFPAMRYADCSTVQAEDIVFNRLKFSVSIQAYYPSLDGYTEEDGYGVIVDNIIGVYMDHNNGILSLSLKDLAADEVFQTLVTKIQILVYLKKAGWNNQPIVVAPSQLIGLLTS